MTRRNQTLLILATAVALSLFAWHSHLPFSQAKAEPAPHQHSDVGIVAFPAGAPQLSSIRVAAVQEVAMPVAQPANGRVAYDENATARIASPILGRVLASRAEVGDRVEHNAPLMELDSPDMAAAEADWRKAQADETMKRLANERAKNLYEHEVIARKDYEAAEADYRQAAAESQRALLRLKNLHASGNENGRFSLRAPIAGIVADKHVNPGQEVRPDLPDPLFVITDMHRLWVIADVPERDIGAIKPGQPVDIETDAYPNERFHGKVDRVGLSLDPDTHRIQVRCIVPNSSGRLRPEMFARVFFLADDGRKGVEVQNTGLIAKGVHSYVFVERWPGTFEKRRVDVTLNGSDASFVGAGLKGGERVVTEGALLLDAESGSDVQ